MFRRRVNMFMSVWNSSQRSTVLHFDALLKHTQQSYSSISIRSNQIDERWREMFYEKRNMLCRIYFSLRLLSISIDWCEFMGKCDAAIFL